MGAETALPDHHLLNLPNEILNIVYEFSVDDVHAYLESPPHKYLSTHLTTHSQHANGKAVQLNEDRHRIMFRDAKGEEFKSVALLGVSRRTRADAIAIIAAKIPLHLLISSFASSLDLSLSLHLLLPQGWVQHVEKLTLPRYIGYLASTPEIVASFPSLKKLHVTYHGRRKIMYKTPWIFTQYRSGSALTKVLRQHVDDPSFHLMLREELRRSFDVVRDSLGEMGRREFMIAVEIKFGSFKMQLDAESEYSMRHKAIVGVASEGKNGGCELKFEYMEEFRKVLAGEGVARLFSWA